MAKKKYYVGLDCGTGSVGWAVTDEGYNLLKFKGKTLWGSRLFDTASTAAERRLARSSRRRTRRSADRIKLLNLIFEDEISKVDPEFYLRLRKSFLLEEDKNLKKNSKNTLFNDKNYTDKDFHKEYPTIWHLRKAIIEAPVNKHFDIRLYYLVIHHILRNRGHFLREGKIKGAGDFSAIFQNFLEISDQFSLNINDDSEALERLIKSKHASVRDLRKLIKEIIFLEGDDGFSSEQDELAGLLAGSKVTLAKIFGPVEDKDAVKLSFASDNYEDKIAEIETELDQDQIALIEAAKAVYDFGFLSSLLNGEEFISCAMVNNYEKHKEELKQLKRLLKPYKDDYDIFFKTEKTADQKICYNAYIGKAYGEKADRKTPARIPQEDINKEIKRLFEKHNIKTDLLEKAERGELLPKQRGQAKGTIPQQLHHNELEIILQRLEKDYPSFAKKTTEPEAYNTKTKKILSIHEFRIPYYCGPLVTGEKSEHAWADEEIATLVRPWNFAELVNLDARADKFIKRMINKCTYLPSEDVLPKSSLLYQKYMVLNELNNLKINDHRIDDVAVKQKIYERVFENGEVAGNITLKNLEKWLRENGVLEAGDTLSGSAESKFLPELSTHRDFIKILGQDYRKNFTAEKLEKVVELITILGNEPRMLEKRIQETLGEKCSSEQAKKLARRQYKDWARFSQKFLTGIVVDINGVKTSILDVLWNTNHNLMEILSKDYPFSAKIEEYNKLQNPPKAEIAYEDIKNLYCSPSVKRTLWQAIRVIDDIVKAEVDAPAKIFIESTREETDPRRSGETLSRHKKLTELYHKLTRSEEAKELLNELGGKEPRDLQSKKLYLYFTQMGRCAYSGERIDIEELFTKSYDIDHIYPRSKTKDDSFNNLVLVKAEYNRDKTNKYPVESKWREKMTLTWHFWQQSGLITKEKLERLTRTSELTATELSGFIARQIVETSQSVKLLKQLLAQKFPNTKIVLVKAGQVSDFRNYFAKGNQDGTNNKDVFEPKPEFIKIRELNDLHHAKDAYLNIVVGNVMNETYTDDPRRWFSKNQYLNYSINSHAIWKATPRRGDYYKGWNYQKSIDIISKNMRRNYVLCTHMVKELTGVEKAGALFDLNLIGKTQEKTIIPRKEGLPVSKYGGYNKPHSAYFALIEITDRKDNIQRRIMQIPILAKGNPSEFLNKTFAEYGNIYVIIPKILINSLIEVDGCRMTLSGKTNDNLIFAPDVQLFFDQKYNNLLKSIIRINKKLSKDNKYTVSERDNIAETECDDFYERMIAKIEKTYKDFPGLASIVEKLSVSQERFKKLALPEKCRAIENVIKAFGANTSVSDLSLVADKAGNVGKCSMSSNITTRENVKLIVQSPTGIFEHIIDLKNVAGGK